MSNIQGPERIGEILQRSPLFRLIRQIDLANFDQVTWLGTKMPKGCLAFGRDELGELTANLEVALVVQGLFKQKGIATVYANPWLVCQKCPIAKRKKCKNW
jgi:hypothetical protein